MPSALRHVPPGIPRLPSVFLLLCSTFFLGTAERHGPPANVSWMAAWNTDDRASVLWETGNAEDDTVKVYAAALDYPDLMAQPEYLGETSCSNEGETAISEAGDAYFFVTDSETVRVAVSRRSGQWKVLPSPASGETGWGQFRFDDGCPDVLALPGSAFVAYGAGVYHPGQKGPNSGQLVGSLLDFLAGDAWYFLVFTPEQGWLPPIQSPKELSDRQELVDGFVKDHELVLLVRDLVDKKSNTIYSVVRISLPSGRMSVPERSAPVPYHDLEEYPATFGPDGSGLALTLDQVETEDGVFNALFGLLYDPGRGWQAPRPLVTFTGPNHYPRLASSGRTPFFIGFGRATHGQYNLVEVTQYSRPSGWSKPQSFEEGYLSSYALSMNPDGLGCLFWNIGKFRASIHSPGQGWQAPGEIFPGFEGPGSYGYDCTAGNADFVIAAAYYNYEWNPSDATHVFFRDWSPGRGWGKLEQRTSGKEVERLQVVGGDQTGLVLWADRTEESWRVWARPFFHPNRSWGAPALVATGAQLEHAEEFLK